MPSTKTGRASGPLPPPRYAARSRRGRRDIQHGQALSHVIGECVHALATHAHAGQIAKQPLGLVIRHFRHQLGGGLLHIELCPPRRQA